MGLLLHPERRYLVHALGNELALTVDACERAVPRHLLQRIRNVSRRRGATIRGVGACKIPTGFYLSEMITEYVVLLIRYKCSPIKPSMLFLSATLNPVLSRSSWDGNGSILEDEFWREHFLLHNSSFSCLSPMCQLNLLT